MEAKLTKYVETIEKDDRYFMEAYKRGIFVEETKYRFHCIVDINGKLELCYLPANCKLEKIVSLKGKTVILCPMVNEESKFKYAVLAVKYRKSLILLNLQRVNSVISEQLHRRIFDFLGERNHVLCEKIINGYKSDIYIEDTNTVIEIKTVLCFDCIAKYPQNYSNHILEQLKKLKRLAEAGYNVYYVIVSLSPFVKEIYVDMEGLFGDMLLECLNVGVKLKGFSLHYKKGKFEVARRINVITEKMDRQDKVILAKK